MSYARFSLDSDVYVFLTEDGIECCACSLDGRFVARITADMIEHLEQHRRAGHSVSDETFRALRVDADENDVWLAFR
jgi:hypothetical protein